VPVQVFCTFHFKLFIFLVFHFKFSFYIRDISHFDINSIGPFYIFDVSRELGLFSNILNTWNK
jgi:hypothetical protein